MSDLILTNHNHAHLSRLGINEAGQPLYEGTDPLGNMAAELADLTPEALDTIEAEQMLGSLISFGRELANPDWSLSVPAPAKQAIGKLLDVIESQQVELRRLRTENEGLEGENFDLDAIAQVNRMNFSDWQAMGAERDALQAKIASALDALSDVLIPAWSKPATVRAALTGEATE